MTCACYRSSRRKERCAAPPGRPASARPRWQGKKTGTFTLRRPTGTYDLFDNQVLTEGQILFDTIHRFKGQQAPAVVLTDVGPPPADPARRAYADRVLFAAMTRATVRLEVVETG